MGEIPTGYFEGSADEQPSEDMPKSIEDREVENSVEHETERARFLEKIINDPKKYFLNSKVVVGTVLALTILTGCCHRAQIERTVATPAPQTIELKSLQDKMNGGMLNYDDPRSLTHKLDALNADIRMEKAKSDLLDVYKFDTDRTNESRIYYTSEYKNLSAEFVARTAFEDAANALREHLSATVLCPDIVNDPNSLTESQNLIRSREEFDARSKFKEDTVGESGDGTAWHGTIGIDQVKDKSTHYRYQKINGKELVEVAYDGHDLYYHVDYSDLDERELNAVLAVPIEHELARVITERSGVGNGKIEPDIYDGQDLQAREGIYKKDGKGRYIYSVDGHEIQKAIDLVRGKLLKQGCKPIDVVFLKNERKSNE